MFISLTGGAVGGGGTRGRGSSGAPGGGADGGDEGGSTYKETPERRRSGMEADERQ